MKFKSTITNTRFSPLPTSNDNHYWIDNSSKLFQALFAAITVLLVLIICITIYGENPWPMMGCTAFLMSALISVGLTYTERPQRLHTDPAHFQRKLFKPELTGMKVHCVTEYDDVELDEEDPTIMTRKKKYRTRRRRVVEALASHMRGLATDSIHLATGSYNYSACSYLKDSFPQVHSFDYLVLIALSKQLLLQCVNDEVHEISLAYAESERTHRPSY